MPNGTKLKRSELYNHVWQEPMIRLAKTYSLSDVGLAKICRKHDIPRPPRGYWAKKQHGQEPKHIPLPHADHDEEIEMREPIDITDSSVTASETAKIDSTDDRRPEPRIEIAESLRGSHELVSLANHELQAAHSDFQGLIERPNEPVLDITVSKSSLRRALLIVDAVLKALEQRGYEVQAGPKVKIMGVMVGFGISEKLELQKEPCEEHDLDGPYSFGHSRFNEKRIPSGRLTLKISDSAWYWSVGCRHTWRDTDTKRLETRLNQVVAGLVEMGARLKQHQEQQRQQEELRKQEELRRQEAARQLAERRKLFKAEKVRFVSLITQAKNWQRSKLVRDLIAAVREAHSAAEPINPNSEIAKWIEWASQQADRLDPLKASPPSILDENLGDEVEPQQGYRRSW